MVLGILGYEVVCAQPGLQTTLRIRRWRYAKRWPNGMPRTDELAEQCSQTLPQAFMQTARCPERDAYVYETQI